MAKMAQSEVIVGLDIGTTKILCLVAEVRGSGDVEIIGVSSHPSKGLQRGIVLNIDSTVQSIRQAIEDAEKMAGTEITRCNCWNSRWSYSKPKWAWDDNFKKS